MAQADLDQRLAQAVARLGTPCGVVYHCPARNERWEHAADELFPTASTIKIAILIELFRRVDLGEIDLAERLTLGHDDQTAGSGIFNEFDRPLTVTLRDIAVQMIVISDNLATNILIDRLGMAAINATAEAIGVAPGALQLRRRMQDLAAIVAGRENVATPRAFAVLLKQLHAGTALSPASCQAVLDIMRRTRSGNTLRGLLPDGAAVAHKPGWNSAGTLACNDAGLMEPPAPADPYVLVVCTRGAPDSVRARLTIQTIAAITWEHATRQPIPALAWLERH